MSKYDPEYYRKNKEKIDARNKAQYKKTADKILAAAKEKRKLRTDDEIAAEKAYRKEYYLKNIEHLKEASKSRYYGTK